MKQFKRKTVINTKLYKRGNANANANANAKTQNAHTHTHSHTSSDWSVRII